MTQCYRVTNISEFFGIELTKCQTFHLKLNMMVLYTFLYQLKVLFEKFKKAVNLEHCVLSTILLHGHVWRHRDVSRLFFDLSISLQRSNKIASSKLFFHFSKKGRFSNSSLRWKQTIYWPPVTKCQKNSDSDKMYGQPFRTYNDPNLDVLHFQT